MEYGTVLVWWALFQAIALAGLPVAAVLGHSLPDRGAGIALPLALVVLFLPVYWVGHLSYGPVAIGVGISLLATTSLLAAWRGVEVRPRRHVEVMIAFTAAFALLVAIRGVDPSIHPAGGEKFLDYGLLRSTLRGTTLPPEDIWFAGEPVRYYYGGHLLSAILATLADTAPKYAYNLALSGAYASLVATAYGVAGATAASRGRSYRFAGALGAFFVGFAGNLLVPLRRLLWRLPEPIARPIASTIEAESAVEAGRVLDIGTFSYWTASRIIPGTINEFPLFAFLNGDLHAHMVSTPFLLLAAGVGLAYLRTPVEEVRRRRLLVLGALPSIAGVLAVINTWSFPTVAGIAWLVLFLGETEPGDLLPAAIQMAIPDVDGLRHEAARIIVATGLAGAVSLLGVLWALPFFLGPASGRNVAVVSTPSALVPFLVVHGAFLVVFWVGVGTIVARRWPRFRGQALGIVAVVLGVGIVLERPGVGLLIPLIIAAWLLRRNGTEAGYETILVAAGAGLLLLIELLYVSEQAGPGRMNTVFKVSMQAWVLWGVAAGAFLPKLLGDARVASWPGPAGIADLATSLGIAILLVSTALYGYHALDHHFEGPGADTLDATTAAQRSHPEEWQAITSLDTLTGQPNLVSAPGCWCNPEEQQPYRWVNAPSSFTGIPTVAGWSHEVGYRGEKAYNRRVAEVETIYNGSWDERSHLLLKYDVEYIYFGPNERSLYGPDTFEERVGEGNALTIAFQNQAVTIYAVHQNRLPSSTDP